MKKYLRILVVIPALSLCNCASIVSKSDYPVTITSSSPKEITVKNKSTSSTVYSGTTPTTVTLSASGGYFQPAKYDVLYASGIQGLNAKIDPWYVGNILFGGIIGLLVDPATGAMWKLPNEVHLNE